MGLATSTSLRLATAGRCVAAGCVTAAAMLPRWQCCCCQQAPETGAYCRTNVQIDVTFTDVGDEDLPEGSFTAAARIISPNGEQRRRCTSVAVAGLARPAVWLAVTPRAPADGKPA